ncbi:hypothetical protein [Catenovulum sediminis]|uniref:Uncharacterized protein n=1 Tax=Catenovulum sediminis TaxID=1740262 RepID=A0ABV1RGW6_9ALTE
MNSNIIAGKKCIVVAPSGYLKGRGSISKKFIESFDLVVKTTDMCEMYDPNFELGSRCDIWYGMPCASNGWRVDLEKLQSQSVQLMKLQPCIKDYQATWNRYIDWFEKQKHSIRYEFSNVEFYQQLVQQLEGIPFSGIFAIADLLNEGAEQVYAYGFDFYRSGYFIDLIMGDGAFNNIWHKPSAQLKYLNKLLENPKFDCDLNLKSILSENPENNEKLVDLDILLEAECRHFQQLSRFNKILLFRTCTENVFEKIYFSLTKCSPPNLIDIVCSAEFQSREFLSESQVFAIPTHDSLDLKQLKRLKIENNYDTFIVPYNGAQILTYLDIFKYILYLGGEEVLLVSTRGSVKRLENLEQVCEEIQEYAEYRARFSLLKEKYDRKYAL